MQPSSIRSYILSVLYVQLHINPLIYLVKVVSKLRTRIKYLRLVYSGYYIASCRDLNRRIRILVA